MEISSFQIIMINGRIIEFAADEVQDYGMVFYDFYAKEKLLGSSRKIT